VRVLVDGGGAIAVKSTSTDATGAFEFAELPAGKYTLSAARPGYVESIYGQQQPGSGRPGTPIQLADAQTIKDLTLKLAKGGVVTGLVTDEYGFPSVGTPVRVYRTVFRNGERALAQAATATTDDRGRYRTYGLLPGEYVIVASPRPVALAAEAAMREARVQAELALVMAQRELVAKEAFEVARAAEVRANGAIATMPPAGPAQGYAPVYFPGTTSASNAARVALGVSEEKSAIDIPLQVVPFSTIHGFVSGVSPMPAALSVYLTETGPLTGLGTRTARVDAEGRFFFTGVPPGQYQLFVRSALRPAVASVASAKGPPIEAAPAQWLWAQSDLAIAGQPRADVSLSLAPGMSISGSVTFRGSSTPPVDPTRVRINFLPLTLSPSGAEMELGTASARVDEQGRFTAVGLMPGRYRVTASGAGSWVLSTVTAQGREALDFPIEVRPGEDVGGVAVTFSDRSTTLEGLLQDATGQPASSYTVVAFADDSRYWTPASRRIQATRPASDGRFSFRNLPAGEYRLAAVIDPEPGQWFDPEFLRQLAAASTPVRLAEGETKTQTLRLGR
jgi:hypothetical protein